jgi:hypothetical protein
MDVPDRVPLQNLNRAFLLVDNAPASFATVMEALLSDLSLTPSRPHELLRLTLGCE